MKNLLLEHFKAFPKKFTLSSPNDENLLIYGENGSGKSSVYDAFRLYYFKEKIFSERIGINVVEGRKDEEDAVVSSYAYDKTTDPITLSIDGIAFCDFEIGDDEQVFLISYDDLHPRNKKEDRICIKDMILKSYFKYERAIENWFDTSAEQEIISNTNQTLKDVFYMDDIILSASQTDDNICFLERINHIDKKKEELSLYFNEATLHLVRFIVLMECISFERNRQKPALLVIDDCFNSLDAPNRTFMMQYLFNETKGMQKIVMTHNMSYYNLMKHVLSMKNDSTEVWLNFILCMVDGEYVLRAESSPSSVDDILANRKAGYYSNSSQLGNAIRQEFEVLVYRLSGLCNIGAMPESKKLLDLICDSKKSVYLSVDANKKAKTASDLVDSIYSSVTNGHCFRLRERIKKEIEEFRANDFLEPLVPALKELRLLQKVALHQASHGHIGLPPVQSKEFDVCLALMKKIDDAISSVKGMDVSTV